jgi:hypothetical protein
MMTKLGHMDAEEETSDADEDTSDAEKENSDAEEENSELSSEVSSSAWMRRRRLLRTVHRRK